MVGNAGRDLIGMVADVDDLGTLAAADLVDGCYHPSALHRVESLARFV